jgi:hypothetical protein
VQISGVELLGTGFKQGYGNTCGMINLSEFRVMPFEKKCDVVTYFGQYLAHRFLGECKVFLYNTDNFFIEVYYSSKYQKVLMINAFEQLTGLEPYLDVISLSDLDKRPTI